MSTSAAIGESWARRARIGRCMTEGRDAAALAGKLVPGRPGLARLIGAAAGLALFNGTIAARSAARGTVKKPGAAEVGPAAAYAAGPAAVTVRVAGRGDVGPSVPGTRPRLTMLGGNAAPAALVSRSLETVRGGFIAASVSAAEPAARRPARLGEVQAASVGQGTPSETSAAAGSVWQAANRERAAATPNMTARLQARGAAAIGFGAIAGAQLGPAWTANGGGSSRPARAGVAGGSGEAVTTTQDRTDPSWPILQTAMGNQHGPSSSQADGVERGGSGGPTQGDVYLDGALVGRWMARTLAAEAGRPASGGTAFDPRRNAFPAGAMIGG